MEFKPLEKSENLPIGHTSVFCHMIFGMNIYDFFRKACIVSGDHMMETPATATHTIIFSCETFRLALVVAALNDLEVKCGYFMNA